MKRIPTQTMKVSFFELEPWEITYLQLHPELGECTFTSEVLNIDNAHLAKDAEIIAIFIYSQINKQLLDALPKLKLIATCSTGFDHIDIEECRKRDIQVVNVPTYGENTVAEHTFALILGLSRKISQTQERLLHGNFSLEGLRGFDLKGKTIGIVGLGHIGRHIARIAAGFEMNVLVHTPHTDIPGYKYVSFEELLQQSDIITFHCPLSDGTRHMLNKKNINLCKKGAYIINTARGPIIETDALIAALDTGHIAGAGLDVLEEEGCFLKEEKQFLSRHFDNECIRVTLENHILLRKPNVIITPHNAFNSEEALKRIYDTTVANIQSFLAGKIQNSVNS